ncbi:uncharacterized protein [Panulirus ornatus]|uniref:uncharacterized protein n=1 Tax=Panulirus ornatus TaxID=150431 RepID=UPI003A8931F5
MIITELKYQELLLSRQASNTSVMHSAVQHRKLKKWKNNVGRCISNDGLNETDDTLQHTDGLTVAYGTVKNSGTDRVQNSILEKPYNFNNDGGESKEHYMHHDSCKMIDLKIANFESSLKDEGNRNISGLNHGENFESKQPPPILYRGHNAEAEKLWNKKMLGMGEYITDQVNAKCCNWKRPNWKTCSEHRTIFNERNKSMPFDFEKCPGPSAPVDTPKRKTNRINVLSSVNCSSVRMKQSWSLKPIHHPSGWLRSTPVAILQQDKHFLYPKLNRTSFLRKAKSDPKLAYQLHAEINYQIKQRLKHLDESFKVELVKIKSKKVVENTCDKKTVGCQTEDNWGANLLNFHNSEKSCTQETVYSLNEDEKYIGKRKNFCCRNEQRFQAEPDVCLEKTFGIRKNGKVRMTDLNRSLTYDTGVTKVQSVSENDISGNCNENFRLSAESESVGISHIAEIQDGGNSLVLQTNLNDNEERSVADLQSGSKEDFASYNDSECVSVCQIVERENSINSYIPQRNESISQERSSSLSLSLSLTEPKQVREQKPTNRIRDSKFEAGHTESKKFIYSKMIVREHSRDTALTCTVDKDLSPSENASKGIACELDQHFTQNVQFSPTHSNVRLITVKNLRPSVDTFSSQVSEIIEATNLSSEVFQEDLGERDADYLMRNGSELHFSEKELCIPEKTDEIIETLSTSMEEELSKGHFSTPGNMTCPEDCLENCAGCSRSDVICELVSDNRILSYSKPVDKTIGIDKSVTEIQAVREKSLSPGNHYKRKESFYQGMNDTDSSISDISAHIAALLMPKGLSIAQLNTDSVSSYVPSDVNDTLSSLTEMVED